LALAQEALSRLRRIQGLAQNFQRHAPAIFEVFGLENDSHATLPQQTRKAVMAELLARLGHASERGRLRQRHSVTRSGLRLGSQAQFEKAFGAQAGGQMRGQLRAASGAPGWRLVLVHS